MLLEGFLPIIVMLVGGFSLVKLRAFFVLKPSRLVREVKSILSKKGAARSLCLALAGTLGVGNIIGVSVGLIVGGAGSILWLLVSSFFAMALSIK